MCMCLGTSFFFCGAQAQQLSKSTFSSVVDLWASELYTSLLSSCIGSEGNKTERQGGEAYIL